MFINVLSFYSLFGYDIDSPLPNLLYLDVEQGTLPGRATKEVKLKIRKARQIMLSLKKNDAFFEKKMMLFSRKNYAFYAFF